MLSHKLHQIGCFKISTRKSNLSRNQIKCQSGVDSWRVSRRVILPATLITAHELLKTNEANAKTPSSSAGDWSSPGLAAPDDDTPKFYKTTSGVKYQIIAEGTGPEAQIGDRVLIDFVLRRANGYFIYATVEGVSFQPKDIPVGPISLVLGSGQIVPGLQDALVGMTPGSKRRILVPPEVGYTADYEPKMPTFATNRQLETHKLEPLLFEVQMLRVEDKR